MKEIFNLVRNDRILSRFFLLSILVIGTSVIYVLLVFRKLPPLVPLYNQLTWGDQRLSPLIGIFLPHFLVLAIILINSILSALVYKKTPLVSRILAVTTLLIAILTFLFVFRTIQIVI